MTLPWIIRLCLKVVIKYMCSKEIYHLVGDVITDKNRVFNVSIKEE